MSTAQQRPVALITGSGRGIGRATLLALAADHDVVVHYRRDGESAKAAADAAAERGAGVLTVRAELESTEDLDALVAATTERFGRIDVFVANAAAGAFLPALHTSAKQARRTLDTIVTSFVHLTGVIAPTMTEGGRIVAVSGSDAGYAVPSHAVIGAAKAGLEALIRCLAVELGPRGITANAVVPGPIATDSSALFFQADPEGAELLQGSVPVGRFGRPEEIAAVIAFLASPAASFVNGSVIFADGGLAAGGGPWTQLTRHGERLAKAARR